MPSRRPIARLRLRQRGVALLIVLWLSIMLTVLASGLAFDTRGEVLAARNTVSRVQAQLRADGAVYRAFYELTRPLAAAERWQADGAVHAWQDDDVSFAVSATDESGRIDLNFASEALLRRLFTVIGGATDEQASAIVAAIQDWRDADDLTRPGGAEAEQYRAEGRKYRPTNQPFESVEELHRVLGVSEEIFSRTAGELTVFSRLPGVNAAVASRQVLLAMPGATEETVDAYVAAREAALSAKQPVPAFPPAAAFNAAAVQVWRIRAEAIAADGGRFTREAVARPSPDPRRVPTIYLWREAG